jgi:hypothetical protein
MVGIVQEQHPDRARLFMQWKQMDWPVMADPLNLLGVSVVPITLAIDENGIIRLINPRPGDLESKFLDRNYAGMPRRPPRQNDSEPHDQGAARSPRELADNLVMSGTAEQYDRAISTYGKLLQASPGNGTLHFRLGVAYRARYDSARRQPGDFANAVRHWAKALEIDPNNYIWRRRIQQYGPRLSKPYPFYDWVETARTEIAARGETPVQLVAEPGQAEIAEPARGFSPHPAPKAEQPDPRGKVTRDRRGYIEIETVVVPPAVKPGKAARVHLVMRPNPKIGAHWNNEAEQTVLWIDPPPGWQVDRRLWTLPHPPQATTTEPRTVEFEIRAPENAPPGSAKFSARVLYNVCEGAGGKCLFRRQDLSFNVEVTPVAP